MLDWCVRQFIVVRPTVMFCLAVLVGDNLLYGGTQVSLRDNQYDHVSNHQPHGCLLNRLFRRRSKKTSKLRVTGLCAGDSPVTGEFPAQRVSIRWRHHDLRCHHAHYDAIVMCCGDICHDSAHIHNGKISNVYRDCTVPGLVVSALKRKSHRVCTNEQRHHWSKMVSYHFSAKPVAESMLTHSQFLLALWVPHSVKCIYRVFLDSVAWKAIRPFYLCPALTRPQKSYWNGQRYLTWY